MYNVWAQLHPPQFSAVGWKRGGNKMVAEVTTYARRQLRYNMISVCIATSTVATICLHTHTQTMHLSRLKQFVEFKQRLACDSKLAAATAPS